MTDLLCLYWLICIGVGMTEPPDVLKAKIDEPDTVEPNVVEPVIA
ncbi:hypothetical protein A2U01_0119028, partial [Trifolium medium]|nr:hypothetical protein [Trifolium medium]